MFNLPVVFQRSLRRSLLRLLEPEDSWIIKADIKVSSFSKWKANFGAGLKSELLFMLKKLEMKVTVLGGANSEQCQPVKQKGSCVVAPSLKSSSAPLAPECIDLHGGWTWRTFTLEIYHQYWRWVKLIAVYLFALLANWGEKWGKRLWNFRIWFLRGIFWKSHLCGSAWLLLVFELIYLLLNLLFTDQCWLNCELASWTLWLRDLDSLCLFTNNSKNQFSLSPFQLRAEIFRFYSPIWKREICTVGHFVLCLRASAKICCFYILESQPFNREFLQKQLKARQNWVGRRTFQNLMLLRFRKMWNFKIMNHNNEIVSDEFISWTDPPISELWLLWHKSSNSSWTLTRDPILAILHSSLCSFPKPYFKCLVDGLYKW